MSTNDLKPASFILFKRNLFNFHIQLQEKYPVRPGVSRYLPSKVREIYKKESVARAT